MVGLKFYNKSHKYKVGKVELCSVTRFVGGLFKPFDAKKVARFLAGLPFNKRAKRGVRYWLADWKRSADHGTKVHEEIERFINGEIFSSEEPQAEKGIKVVKEYKEQGFKLYSEYRTHDLETKLAGTIDLLVIKPDGKASLVDWKTNKKMTTKAYDKDDKGLVPLVSHLDNCKTNLYALQLLVYSYLIEKELGVIVDELRVVHLRPDGKTDNYYFPIDKNLRDKIISYRVSSLEEDS